MNSSGNNTSCPETDVIYLDTASRTRIDPRVLDAIRESYLKHYSDPQNTQHRLGRESADAVWNAKRKVGERIGGDPQTILFAAGATEANNLAVFGAARAAPERRHIITFETEPASVFAPCQLLESEFGYRLSVLSTDSSGRPDHAEIMRCITDDTLFVSISLANKEVGTLQDLPTISSMTRTHGALLHSDCSLAFGRTAIDVNRQRIDLLTLSGHNIHGPYGTSLVWVRPGTAFAAASNGHNASRDLDVPNIVGLATAVELAGRETETTSAKLQQLTEHLKVRLCQAIDNIYIVTPETGAAPGLLYLSIEDIESNDLMAAVDGVAFSAGQAASIGKPKPGRTSRAVSLPSEMLHNYIRLSPDKHLTLESIDSAVSRLAEGIRKLRAKTG